jgi:hypothetical protein
MNKPEFAMAIPLHIREKCRFVSDQIRKGIPLDQRQRQFWADVLEAIADGQDPRSAFGAEPRKGKKRIDELTQEKIRSVIQKVFLDLALAKKERRKLTIADAIRLHVVYANSLFGYDINNPVLNYEKIRRWWDAPKYQKYKTLPDKFIPL